MIHERISHRKLIKLFSANKMKFNYTDKIRYFNINFLVRYTLKGRGFTIFGIQSTHVSRRIMRARIKCVTRVHEPRVPLEDPSENHKDFVPKFASEMFLTTHVRRCAGVC